MARKIRIEENEKTVKNWNHDKLKICSLIVNLILLIAIIILIIMYVSLNSNSVSKNKYNTMLKYKDKEISSLEFDINSFSRKGYADLVTYGMYNNLQYYKNKLQFMDNNIVFVIKGYDNYYYDYDCMINKYKGSYTYWAYNKEAAISKGLKAGGC